MSNNDWNVWGGTSRVETVSIDSWEPIWSTSHPRKEEKPEPCPCPSCGLIHFNEPYIKMDEKGRCEITIKRENYKLHKLFTKRTKKFRRPAPLS